MRILVVDDSRFIHPHIEAYLRAGGYSDLLFAMSAAEAFKVLGMDTDEPGNGIDLILMDVMMPDVDGIEAVRRIRTVSALDDIPMVMITADTGQETLLSAFEAGAVDYITKPLNRMELLARVGSVLRLKRETDIRKANQRALRRMNSKLEVAYDRIAREIDLVAGLQARLLPRTSPLLPGLHVESTYKPSTQASGDYYDYFVLDDRTVRLVMADAAGHGAQSAFLMAIVRTLIRLGKFLKLELAATMSLVNSQLCEIVGNDTEFVTLFVADIDIRNGIMSYVNAGHCPGLLRADNGEAILLGAMTPPAGVLEMEYETSSVHAGASGELLLFTDGYYEWEESPGEYFGLDAFIGVCESVFADESATLGDLNRRMEEIITDSSRFKDDLAALRLTWTEVPSSD